MRFAHAAAAVASLATVATVGSFGVLAASCRHGGAAETHKPAAVVIDAGPPDASPDAAPDAAPPAHLSFAPAPWTKGQQVRLWRRTTLSGISGSDDVVQKEELAFTVTGATSDGGVDVLVRTDCTAVIARGTAKVTGACDGDAPDVAYKLDLVAQLLAVAHGTVTVGDATGAFGRPLVALFRLQDAGAIVSARVGAASDAGATYTAHVQLDGLMLRPGMHLLGELDGQIQVDAHATTMTGTFSAPRVTVTGYPMADYSAKGALELAFGIEPK